MSNLPPQSPTNLTNFIDVAWTGSSSWNPNTVTMTFDKCKYCLDYKQLGDKMCWYCRKNMEELINQGPVVSP